MVVDMEIAEQIAPTETEGDPLWSLERAAKYMDVSVKQVRRWCEQGLIRVVRLGPKLLRIRRSDVEAFIIAHSVTLSE